jgi:hypothetical protein
MNEPPRQLGERRFTDGTTRPVFVGADGRQYVEDDGERAQVGSPQSRQLP